MNKEICCVNFKGLFAFLRRHYGEQGVDQVVEGLAGDQRYLVADRLDSGRLVPLQKEHLTDPAVWISEEVSSQILANVSRVVPGPHPLFTAGEGSVSEALSKTALMAVRVFGVGFAARQVAALNRRFNRTKTVTLVRLSKGSAVLRLDYFPGFAPSREVCDWNRGIYSGVVKSTGAGRVTVRETSCSRETGDGCVFEVRWRGSNLFKRVKRRLLGGLLGEMAVEYERAMAERDHLIEGLGRSERRYRSLFDSAGEAIMLIENEMVLDCNPRACVLFGASRDDIVGRPLLALSPELQHDGRPSADRLRELLRAAGSGRAQFFRWRLRRLDGAPVEAEVSLSRVEPGGRGLVQATVRDVTERVEAERALKVVEQQLRQAQKMEAVGTLAGGIAHDFNNILGVIVGYTEVAMDGAARGEVDPGDLEKVLQAALRARNLVRQILTFSRRSGAEMSSLELNQAVEGAVGMLERTLPKNVTIKTRCWPEPVNTLGNANQIEQVILNLATNARDAMPDGGTLRIETAMVEVDRQDCLVCGDEFSGRYAMLTVSDDGVGMDENTTEHIFDPFFTTKEVGKGTGLGLSTVYGIVKGHRSHLSCSSAPGKGTTFCIYLPPQPGSDALAARTESPPLDRHGRGWECLLLVDDEETLRELGERVLSGAGYSVLQAASGEQALEVLNSVPGAVDLVILDLDMPGMGGRRCLARILSADPGARVIIASGYGTDFQVEESFRDGALGYVAKPFRKDELLATVRRVLDRKPD